MRWKFSFWTAGNAPKSDSSIFGCSSHGMAAGTSWIGDNVAGIASFGESLEGEVITGSYAEVLTSLEDPPCEPKAVIILFAGEMGVEAFLEQWNRLFPGVPVAGGAAARLDGSPRGELHPLSEDAAVLLLSEGTWTADTLNVHDRVASEWAFRADGPRDMAQLRPAAGGQWQAAAAVFRTQQAARGRNSEDCETITFSDAQGRNLHVWISGDHLYTGANLPSEGPLFLRTVEKTAVAGKLDKFCFAPNSIVFGCAGLRGLIDKPLAVGTDGLAGFMFGELVTLGGQAQFGNLMASRLVLHK